MDYNNLIGKCDKLSWNGPFQLEMAPHMNGFLFNKNIKCDNFYKGKNYFNFKEIQ